MHTAKVMRVEEARQLDPMTERTASKSARERYAREHAYSLFPSVTQGVHWVKWVFEIVLFATELRFVYIESVILRDNEASIFARKIDQLRHVNGSMDGSFAVGEEVKRKRPEKCCCLAGNWNGE